MPRYAAVDIGSNSVRMMAAEVNPGETRIIAEDRQVTRLGESVFRSGRIAKDALDFLCANLARMAAIYSRLDVVGLRAVATSAVRDASNQDEFLQRAGTALGTNIEIISGPEEARLIHLGVEARWPRPKERTLIIDVLKAAGRGSFDRSVPPERSAAGGRIASAAELHRRKACLISQTAWSGEVRPRSGDFGDRGGNCQRG